MILLLDRCTSSVAAVMVITSKIGAADALLVSATGQPF